MIESGEIENLSWQGSAVFSRADGVILREIAGEALLVPVQKGLANLQVVFVLNGIGAHIWEHLDGQKNLDEILSSVLGSYDVSQDQARGDVESFIGSLESLRLIEPRD